MKVLMFVTLPTPDMAERFQLPVDSSGQFIHEHLNELRKLEEVELTVACGSSDFPGSSRFIKERVQFCCISIPKPGGNRIVRGLRMLIGNRKNMSRLGDESVKIADSGQPDVIFVHGTERPYGLMAGRVPYPIVCNVAGVLTEYSKVYFGRLGLVRKLSYSDPLFRYFKMLSNAKLEREVFARNRHFIGRTDWDRGCVEKHSPGANYYWGGDLIRPEFHRLKWDFERVVRHRITATVTCLPYKGIDVLLNAAARLKPRHPDFSLHINGDVPQNGLGAYFRNLPKKLGIEKNVTFRGKLEVEAIRKELIEAHVFVLASFIENAPNSLAEAQLVGTPIVSTVAGGVPSMVEDGKTGLLCPINDDKAMADQIGRFFEDDRLALSCSENGRAAARERHDVKRIMDALMAAFRQITVKPSSR